MGWKLSIFANNFRGFSELKPEICIFISPIFTENIKIEFPSRNINYVFLHDARLVKFTDSFNEIMKLPQQN